MKKIKKITAVLLAGVMSLSMIGCGSEKKSKEAKSVDVSGVKTMSDAFGLINSYENGESNLTLDMNVEADGQKASVYLSSAGEKSGSDQRIGAYLDVNYDGRKMSLNLPYVVTKYDDKLYIDFGKLVKSVSDVDTELGNLAVPAPTIDEKKRDDSRDKMVDFAKGLIDAMLEGAEVSEDGGTFTAKISNPEGFNKGFLAAVKYIDENRDKFIAFVKSTEDIIDYKEYTEKLFKDLEKDILAASDAGGMGLTKDSLKDFEKKIVDMMAEKQTTLDEDELNSAIDALKTAAEGAGDDIWSRLFGNIDTASIEVSIKAEKEKFTAEAKIDLKSPTGNIKIEGSYEFNIKEVKIEKPVSIKSLEDMVNYIQSDQTIMTKIYTGLMKYSAALRG